jgi:hypothetical protein
MKCSALQTTSTVPNTRDVAADFTALLFAQAFAPLAKAIGFYGESVVAEATRAMARSERGGLTDHLDRALENASRSGIMRTVP